MVAFGFVTLYGNRTPRWEDWFFVPFITGAQRIDPSWLWEDVQGHRVPILKLVLCACYSVFGFNSKPILYLNVLLFSALSLGLLWAIRKVRGRWSYADACLPIVLLNLGQAEAFSWAQTFAYLSATCLETLLLIVIVTNRGALNQTSVAASRGESRPPAVDFRRRRRICRDDGSLDDLRGMCVERKPRALRSPCLADCAGLALVTVLIIGLYFVGYRPLTTRPGAVCAARIRRLRADGGVSTHGIGIRRSGLSTFVANLRLAHRRDPPGGLSLLRFRPWHAAG